MRLVDMEPLDVISFQATGDTAYDQGFEDGVQFVAEKLDAAPTIDAIPVEWLWKVRNDDRITIDEMEAIDLILAWWQEEQEAR